MSRFAEVASLIGGDPDKVVSTLERYATLITGPEPGASDLDDKELLVVMDWLHSRLAHEAKVIEALEQLGLGFDLGEELDAINNVSTGLCELMDYLKSTISPGKEGNPFNNRRRICAGACAKLWCAAYGKITPHSPALWDACEAYWVACGNAPYAELKNWRGYLTEFRNEVTPSQLP
jgi:hypothetical protein